MFVRTEGKTDVVALLGPTNTGKTHRAIERMLEHQSGMIGLPLRLLAREVYDRITARIGERVVALITGEEKRVPRHPKYWICTVEAMPLDLEVDFLAIDEIQLGAHRERGHIFTDRLLNARGRCETWFLGSETVRPLIQHLVPTAKIRNHPRLSRLHGKPAAGVSSLPKRSAVVAFSSQRVYELADRIRVKHGGAAIVLGALSPRTRNAQVALYQAGDVDYLVATDAIGMGLNLDIRHIAFADVNKFDGRESRPLDLVEMAQIAGRAGRYLDDGTFGVLAPREALPQAVVRALECHRFPNESRFFWRNSHLDLSSINALSACLRETPHRRELRPIEPATDHLALLGLTEKVEIRRLADSVERVTLLWEVCQIPDYPQLLFELHLRLLEQVFLQLNGSRQRLDSTWIEAQLHHIDRVEGDIESLMGRISQIRTWNYISQRANWIDDELALADRARQVEDRLSDALHTKLVARFVERRRSFSIRNPPGPRQPPSGLKPHPFAQLLLSHSADLGDQVDPIAEQARFTDSLVEAAHDRFQLTHDAQLLFDGRRVGNLIHGADVLHPDVQVHLDPDPGRGACTRVRRRLLAFSRDLVEQLLAPMRQPTLGSLSGPARGLIYQLEHGLGTVRVHDCEPQLAELSFRERQILCSHGLRVGHTFVYVRRLLESEAIVRRHALSVCHFGPGIGLSAESLALPVAHHPAPILPHFLTMIGLAPTGPLILRVDRYERLVSELWNYDKAHSFNAPRDLGSRLGCAPSVVPELLEALGYAMQPDGKWSSHARKCRKHDRSTRGRRPSRPAVDSAPHSPTDNSSESKPSVMDPRSTTRL